MNYPLFIGLVGLLALLNFWIGKNASKNLKNNEDYFLMGRNLTFFPLTFTLLATQLGGGTLVGACQTAYQEGWVVLFYPLGVCLGLLGLGLGFGEKLRKLNISTVAEIFETIYKTPSLRYFSSALSVITLFCILIGQAIAIRTLFTTLGFDSPLLFLAFWAVLVAYTVMGGLKAVVNTDVLQAFFILFALILSLITLDGSLLSFSREKLLAASSLSSVPFTQWLLMPFLFMFIEQDMGQRCFAAKDGKTIRNAAISSSLLLMGGSCAAIFFGTAAKGMGLSPPENSNILVETIKVLTNPITTSVFMAAIFMAVISTADSLLCSISSNLACDFFPNEKGMTFSRVLTLVTGALSFGAAYLFTDVVSVLMFSYELSVSLLFVPIMGGIFLKAPSKEGAYGSIFFGALGYLVFMQIEIPFPREIASLTLSFCGYFIGKITQVVFKKAPIIN